MKLVITGALGHIGSSLIRNLGGMTWDEVMLIDNLAGFPDNISTGSDGLIWITQFSPRDAILDRLLPMAPVLRKIVWALPEFLQPQPKKMIWVLAVDADGSVVHELQDHHSRLFVITGVRERDGRVYLGSLESKAIGVASIA